MKHPVDVHVGKRVRHRRWIVGMSQQQLGDSAGITFQQIQKYETGDNRIVVSRLWEMAHTLHVPISYFFEGLDGKTGTAQAATAPEAYRADPLSGKEALELVRFYYAIPEVQRRRLFDLVRVLSDSPDDRPSTGTAH